MTRDSFVFTKNKIINESEEYCTNSRVKPFYTYTQQLNLCNCNFNPCWGY